MNTIMASMNFHGCNYENTLESYALSPHPLYQFSNELLISLTKGGQNTFQSLHEQNIYIESTFPPRNMRYKRKRHIKKGIL